MEFRERPREFFWCRYIYYSENIEKLGKVYFSIINGKERVDYYFWDSKTGKEKLRRVTNKNKEWNKYRTAAINRKLLKQKLKELINDYKKEWGGSLSEDASHFRIVKNADNRFDSQLYSTFTNNQRGITDDHKFRYRGIPMCSEFETDIAGLIDDLDIAFKYEVKLDLNEFKCRYPDFALAFPEFNRCCFLEYLGALDNFSYVNKNSKKFEEYSNLGLYIGRDVVYVSGDDNYRPDKKLIREMIMTMYAAIARMHLIKVN